MQVTIEISQAQYHAISVRYINADQWIETQVRQMGDKTIDQLYADEQTRAQVDPSYVLMPDKEAVILALPIPDATPETYDVEIIAVPVEEPADDV